MIGAQAPTQDVNALFRPTAEVRKAAARVGAQTGIGAEFHDEDDFRYLLRHLDLRSYDQVIGIIEKHYSLDLVPQKTLYALTELLPDK